MANEVDTKTLEIEKRIDPTITKELMIGSPGGAMAIVPQNMQEVMEFAKLMSVSGVAVRQPFRNNPGMCLAVTLQAMKWGADPFAVANKSYVVNDQLAFESQLIHAVIITKAPLQKRLKVTYHGEGQAKTCKVEGLLVDEDEPKIYETPPIGNINPKNSPNWKNDPEQQLHYFAVRAWARRWVPDVLLGIYAVDELEDRHRGPDNAIDVTPPRPSRENDHKGDPAEHDRIRQEVEADEPKNFVVYDAVGDVIAEDIGPRAFIKLFAETMIETAKGGDSVFLGSFFDNHDDMLAMLEDHNFTENVHALKRDFSALQKRLAETEAKGSMPRPETSGGEGSATGRGTSPHPNPGQSDQMPVSEGSNGQGAAAQPSDGGENGVRTTSDGREDQNLSSGPENASQSESADSSQTSSNSVPQKEQAEAASPSGTGAEESQKSAITPPEEFWWVDMKGQKRPFPSPKAWEEYVSKGAKHKDVTGDMLRKAKMANADLFTLLISCGGEYKAAAERVEAIIDERIKALKK